MNKPLIWSEPVAPEEGCRYHHVTANTPFGEFSIQWKGWKEHDDRTVFFNGEFLLNGGETLDEAKMQAEGWWQTTLQACGSGEELEEEVAALQHWRDLALQFDNHRMQALAHLKSLLYSSSHAAHVNRFLAAPPMAPHEVVAERDRLRSELSKAHALLTEASGKLYVDTQLKLRIAATLAQPAVKCTNCYGTGKHGGYPQSLSECQICKGSGKEVM